MVQASGARGARFTASSAAGRAWSETRVRADEIRQWAARYTGACTASLARTAARAFLRALARPARTAMKAVGRRVDAASAAGDFARGARDGAGACSADFSRGARDSGEKPRAGPERSTVAAIGERIDAGPIASETIDGTVWNANARVAREPRRARSSGARSLTVPRSAAVSGRSRRVNARSAADDRAHRTRARTGVTGAGRLRGRADAVNAARSGEARVAAGAAVVRIREQIGAAVAAAPCSLPVTSAGPATNGPVIRRATEHGHRDREDQ